MSATHIHHIRRISLFSLFLVVFLLSACRPIPSGQTEDSTLDSSQVNTTRKQPARQVTFTSEEDAQNLVRNGERVVYFFKTASCASCKTAQKDLDTRLSTYSTPFVVVVVEYDKEPGKTLKEKYGISSDHTWIQIDADGNVVTKWQGGTTDELVSNIK